MAKEVVVEKAVETVAEKAEPLAQKIVESGIKPSGALIPKFAKGDPKVVVGTVVVVGGILVGGYFLKKKLSEKKATKEEVKVEEPAKGDE